MGKLTRKYIRIHRRAIVVGSAALQKSHPAAVQSNIINLNKGKRDGRHNNIHTYCHIETSSLLPQPSPTILKLGPPGEGTWYEQSKAFIPYAHWADACATPVGIRCTNTSASDIIHRAQSSGPMTNEHFRIPRAPMFPGQDFNIFHRQSVGWK